VVFNIPPVLDEAAVALAEVDPVVVVAAVESGL
jgi:hypothetical protein